MYVYAQELLFINIHHNEMCVSHLKMNLEMNLVFFYIMWMDALVCNVYRQKHSYLAALVVESRLIMGVLWRTQFFSLTELGSMFIVQRNRNDSMCLNILGN